MTKVFSKLLSLFPESDFKNYVRCILYNLWQSHLHIKFVDKKFLITIEGFELRFYKNPYHLIVEQQQYNRHYSLKQGDIVIDAGGFWGTYALYASKIVGDTGKVLVLEPDSMNRKELEKNIQLNDVKNITVIPKGLWSTVCSLPFNDGGELGSSFIEVTTSANQVKVTTLDSILDEYSLHKIDFVKMDVEGAELEALDGALKTLNKGSNFAIASYHIVDNEPTYKLLEKKFKSHNYKVLTDRYPEFVTFASPKKSQ